MHTLSACRRQQTKPSCPFNLKRKKTIHFMTSHSFKTCTLLHIYTCILQTYYKPTALIKQILKLPVQDWQSNMLMTSNLVGACVAFEEIP